VYCYEGEVVGDVCVCCGVGEVVGGFGVYDGSDFVGVFVVECGVDVVDVCECG